MAKPGSASVALVAQLLKFYLFYIKALWCQNFKKKALVLIKLKQFSIILKSQYNVINAIWLAKKFTDKVLYFIKAKLKFVDDNGSYKW